MTHQQAILVASVLSGRVDVCDLAFDQRSMLGIRFDPKNSVEDKHEALRCLEKLLVAHLEK